MIPQVAEFVREYVPMARKFYGEPSVQEIAEAYEEKHGYDISYDVLKLEIGRAKAEL